ncbi:MAG: hypothetical protein J6X02_05840 [Bacilli bacterium]|nr:hypothetical protein [Bacilli bacterium]
MHNLQEGDIVLKEIVLIINRLYKKTKLVDFLSKPSKGLYNTIYHTLVYHNVSKEERHYQIDKDNLFKRFKDKERSNVYTFIEPYCCHFVSRDFKANSKTSHLKVYLPLNYQYIEDGVNSILDFLNENNFSYDLKVCSKVRNDDVIVRLINKDDLKKLLDFIKKDKMLSDNLLKPNPFAFIDNNIALASDGAISYNGVVANYIMLYLVEVYKKNGVKGLDDLNLKEFYHFVIDYYAKTFVSHENLDKFSKDFIYVNENKPVNYKDSSVYNDFMFVSKLIVESQAKDYSLNRYLSHYEMMVNTKNKKYNEDRVKKMLQSMVATMLRKRDNSYTLDNIENYINTGDCENLTRFENCRNEVCNSNFRKDFLDMVSKYNLNIHEYLDKAYQSVIKLDPSISDILRDYMEAAIIKYDSYDDALDYLRDYLETRDEAYITREYNLRNRFIALKVSTYLEEYIDLTGRKIEDIISSIVNNKR